MIVNFRIFFGMRERPEIAKAQRVMQYSETGSFYTSLFEIYMQKSCVFYAIYLGLLWCFSGQKRPYGKSVLRRMSKELRGPGCRL